MRGLERIFGVSRTTIYNWLVPLIQSLPNMRDTLLPAQVDDELEFDEVWSFIYEKAQKLWVWTMICRRTRQILAFVLGDHSMKSCLKLWSRIPDEYRQCRSFSDFWKAYQVLPGTHQQVGKQSGEINHMERWYSTLRQRLARLVRKTLSFSKRVSWHHRFIKWYIVDYNCCRQAAISSFFDSWAQGFLSHGGKVYTILFIPATHLVNIQQVNSYSKSFNKFVERKNDSGNRYY